MFKWSFYIGKIFGVEVKIHFSLLVIFVFYIGRDYLKYGYFDASLALLIFFVYFSIFFHEFVGHAGMVKLLGGDVRGILLHGLGGFTFYEMKTLPVLDFLIAFAGPQANFMFGGMLSLLREYLLSTGLLLPERFMDVLDITAHFNFYIALLNLVPLYPLDGGTALQAALKMRNTPQARIARAMLASASVCGAVLLAHSCLIKDFLLFGIVVVLWFVALLEFGGSKKPPLQASTFQMEEQIRRQR